MRTRSIITAATLALTITLIAPATSRAQCGELLVDPGFENGPGSIQNSYLVVHVQLTTGFWGASSTWQQPTDSVTACGTPPLLLPHSGQWMVGWAPSPFNSNKQLVQAVQLPVPPPATLAFSGWFDACSGGTATVTLSFYETRQRYTVLGHQTTTLSVDAVAGSWEPLGTSCVAVPPQAGYALLAITIPGGIYVDDLSLTCDACTVPVKPTTWGLIKALYRP